MTTRPERSRPVSAALPEGSRVGAYLVEAHLASGGFGDVYRARHVEHGRAGALKVLHASLAHTRDAPLRFEREARSASRIHHPNVVEIYDFGLTDDGRPYFVMEMLAGLDLGEHIRTSGRVPLSEAVEITDQLAGALGAAHALGIVHRDLKASNVFLEDWSVRRRVVLLDFGIAKLLGPDAEDLTASRKIVGTPVCMAPEQIRGGIVDGRTDVYALGALVYHMLTGKPPFDDESATVTQYLHMSASRPRPSDAINVSRAVDQVVERAMAIARDERHASVGDLASAFRRAALASVKQAERAAEAIAAYVEGPAAEDVLAAAGMTVVVRSPGSATGVAVEGVLQRVTSALSAAARDRLVLVNRGTVTLRGDEITGGELLRLARWGRPPRGVSGVFVAKSALFDSPADAPDFVPASGDGGS